MLVLISTASFHLISYHFSITRVPMFLSSMTMQDSTRPSLHGSFWHKLLTLFCGLPYPNLNPIKHIWDELGWQARKNHQINTLQDLQRTLTQEWSALPNTLIPQYANTIRRQNMAVIRAPGGPTHLGSFTSNLHEKQS